MDEDFAQNDHPKTAKGIIKKGHSALKFLKWTACFVICDENLFYFDQMASVLSALKEIAD